MSRRIPLLLAFPCLLGAWTPAQDQPPAPAPKADQEKLEQLVAPIALYPDALLTQVLMAATYPLEIVEAARWQKQNASLTGEALEKALQDKTWDPSVKALCGLPTVLARMNEHLDWTQDLGDAFLGDQQALMDVVQQMRRKALDAGKLESTKEQKVTEQDDKIIVIEPADPQVIYVPTYYPTVVYGGWYYPRYYYPALYVPPPPGYVAFAFAVGVTWGWAMWGGCHWGWGHTTVNINVNRYNTFVNKTEIAARQPELRDRAKQGQWQHDPQHRKGVRYPDASTAQRFGGAGGSDRVSREQARGFAPTNRPATAQQPAARPAQPAARPGTTPAARPERPAARPAAQPSGQRSGTFSGSRNAGADRAASQRGNASRGASGGGARPARTSGGRGR